MNGDEKVSTSIKSHGGKRPGAGRPLGSQNVLTRPLKEAAAEHSEACLNVLVELRDHGLSEQVRLAAAMAILDRAHGRPRQGLDVSKDDKIVVVISRQRFPTLDDRASPAKLEGPDEP